MRHMLKAMLDCVQALAHAMMLVSAVPVLLLVLMLRMHMRMRTMLRCVAMVDALCQIMKRIRQPMLHLVQCVLRVHQHPCCCMRRLLKTMLDRVQALAYAV